MAATILSSTVSVSTFSYDDLTVDPSVTYLGPSTSILFLRLGHSSNGSFADPRTSLTSESRMDGSRLRPPRFGRYVRRPGVPRVPTRMTQRI